MDAIPYTTLRANLASQMDRVCEDHAPIIVTRKASGIGPHGGRTGGNGRLAVASA